MTPTSIITDDFADCDYNYQSLSGHVATNDTTPLPGVTMKVSGVQTNQDFAARIQNYTVGGIVRLGTAGLGGVTVTLSSPSPTDLRHRQPPRVATESTRSRISRRGATAPSSL